MAATATLVLPNRFDYGFTRISSGNAPSTWKMPKLMELFLILVVLNIWIALPWA